MATVAYAQEAPPANPAPPVPAAQPAAAQPGPAAQPAAPNKAPAANGAPVPRAAAKAYLEIFFADSPKWKSLRAKLVEAGQAENEEETKAFTDHFNSIAAELTQYSGAKDPKDPNAKPTVKLSEKGDKISETRNALKRDLVMLAKRPSTGLHDSLVSQLSNVLPKFFNSDKYHPVTRINSLQLYGDLNSKEGDSAIVPLAAAFPVLLKILTTDTQPAYMRATAMYGLARHAEANLSADSRKELTAEMLKLLKAPPPNLKPEVYDFMRIRAVETLRNLAKGPEANSDSVLSALFTLVENKKGDVPLELRCEALRALGSIDSKLIKPSYVARFAQAYGKLAIEIARQAAPPEKTGDEDAADPTTPTPATTPAPIALADAGPSPMASVTAGQDPDAINPGGGAAPAGAPATDAAAPIAAAATPAKPNGILAPDVQTYLLGCVQIAIKGDNPKNGLASAADFPKVDPKDKKLVADISTKLFDISKYTKNKPPHTQLSVAEFDKMGKAIDELEKLFAGAPQARAE